MVNPVGILAWNAVVANELASPRVRASDEQPAPATIAVVVRNFADIPPGILDRAQVEAGLTYRRMGIRTTWLGSAPFDGGTAGGSMAPTTNSEFTITLIIQPGLAGSSGHGSRSVMAAAPPSQSDREGSIYVFYDRVTDVAAIQGADTALLMGLVIAHEMGHLLLRHADHSAEGLMRGVWDADAIRRGAIGLLWFSRSELRQIRTTLSTCCPTLPIPASPNPPLGQRDDRDVAVTTPFDNDLRLPRLKGDQLVERDVQASASMFWPLDGSANCGTENDGLLAETQPSEACAAREAVPDQVRPLSCDTAVIVMNGMARSATLSRLVDRVGQLKGIVYIVDSYSVNSQTRRVSSGALSHRISMAGAHRVLQVIVAPESGDRRLITMAHELQHAIEVLEATDVASEAAVDQLFERIGMQTSAGVMETQAALDVGRTVGRELLDDRASGRRSIGAVPR